MIRLQEGSGPLIRFILVVCLKLSGLFLLAHAWMPSENVPTRKELFVWLPSGTHTWTSRL